MRTLRIVDTHDKLVGFKEVKDYDEAWNYVFDTFGCCWSVIDLDDVIEATIYPECAYMFKA